MIDEKKQSCRVAGWGAIVQGSWLYSSADTINASELGGGDGDDDDEKVRMSEEEMRATQACLTLTIEAMARRCS